MDDARITTTEALERALGARRYLLLKHSERCGISRSAYGAMQAFVAECPDVPHGWIDVRADRGLSDHVARATSIRHESPQALWVVDGQVAWSATHFDITAEALARAVNG